MAKGLASISRQRAWRINALVRCLGGVALMLSSAAHTREYHFSPSALEGDQLPQQDIDLSLFSHSNTQLPGVYPSRILLNDLRVGDASITYLGGKRGELARS